MNNQFKSITELARELRSNPTADEKRMWEILRKRRFHGYRFLRQKPIVHEQHVHRHFFYIADFYCAELKLVIELDGKVHDFQKEYDLNRDTVMKNLGLKVLRIKNEELQNIEAVKQKMKMYI